MPECYTRKRNDTKTSVVNGYQVFPRIGFDSHFENSSGVSISLKLSNGCSPVALIRWRVCTMFVFTCKFSVDLE
jgi:hypothetical protein